MAAKWWRLEADDQRIKLDEFLGIAKILGVTVSHLCGEQPIVLPGLRKAGRPPGAKNKKKPGAAGCES